MASMNCAAVKWNRECDINFSLSSTLECHHVHLQTVCAGPCTGCKTTVWGWERGKNSGTNYSRRWKQNEKCCSPAMVCQRPGLEHLMERRKLRAASQSWWLWTSTCFSEELDEALQNFVKPWKNVVCELKGSSPVLQIQGSLSVTCSSKDWWGVTKSHLGLMRRSGAEKFCCHPPASHLCWNTLHCNLWFHCCCF